MLQTHKLFTENGSGVERQTLLACNKRAREIEKPDRKAPEPSIAQHASRGVVGFFHYSGQGQELHSRTTLLVASLPTFLLATSLPWNCLIPPSTSPTSPTPPHQKMEVVCHKVTVLTIPLTNSVRLAIGLDLLLGAPIHHDRLVRSDVGLEELHHLTEPFPCSLSHQFGGTLEDQP